jgi:hypothetical protein
MADISALGGLQPIETLDLGNYADRKESSFQLPTKGRYTVQAPSSFPAAAFGRTKKTGALSAQVDPTIVGPTNAGFTIRFTKVSATTFKRNGQTVSQVGDYLRACGFNGTLSNEQEIADAVESTAGATYDVKLDWRVYNSRTGFQLEGMERFPKNADGSHQPWVNDPVETNPETGEPVRLRANVVVTEYIPVGR